MKLNILTFLFLLLGITQSYGQIEDDARFNDLPPKAEYGRCYAKCKTPDIYETFSRKVLVEEAYVKTTTVPAVYETVEKQVMLTEGGINYKTIPPNHKMARKIEEGVLFGTLKDRVKV